jgi:cysteine-rich repeat protein
MQPGEACDLGMNNSNAGACTLACKTATCGDTFVQQGVEQCDDGNAVNTDACTAACKTATCGDTFVQQGVEQCDDGNTVNADGCTNACTTPKCGDGILQAQEECDDANTVNADTCSLLCHKTPKTAPLGAGQSTATHGGGGGAPFNLACPNGQALIGFNGRSANLVDQLAGLCGAVSVGVLNDKFVIKAPPAANLSPVGGGGGGPFNSLCPADQLLVGYSGRAGAYIDAIRFSCVPLVITEDNAGFKVSPGMITNLAQFGGGGGGVIPQTNCPAGQIANRKTGRSGGYIDQFGLGCASFGLGF